MQLILTHENADFDAVASQLAAHKLYPAGTPLLSRRINRNVQQFLTLYWDALPFMRPTDWKRQRVDEVLLVDTHSMNSVRGMVPSPQVQVFDHHEIRQRKDGWLYCMADVGAATTLLAEMLQTSGKTLSSEEATLLLLGIYEDTGSLLYDTTTVKDVQMAGWLLEQGGQLAVVRRFMNVPLTPLQWQLYERLQTAVSWIEIGGRSVALTAVAAPDGFEDEISSIVHRLRDALLPVGLFVLVQLGRDVQLVARSNHDSVDVSVVARALGGGGHRRAAAAIIIGEKLADVAARTRELLPQAVKPVATVAEIMSYGVKTLLPTTKVAAAAKLMQRFGYEGYPVVDEAEGVLAGLLTRRAVDRAMSHKLSHLPVSRIMKAGNFTVRPSDSIEQVQQLMLDEGWGQIPVIADKDDEKTADANETASGNLIGVVTRTDVLGFLFKPTPETAVPDMRHLLNDTFSPALWGMLLAVSQTAAALHMPLYFVGGLVRDLLLGKTAVDLDMVVEGDAIKLAHDLQDQFGGDVHVHRRFGTAKWSLKPDIWQAMGTNEPVDAGTPHSPARPRAHSLPASIDFVTARSEFYTEPSALPEVVQGSIKLDLHRRDFTINTLALRLDGAHLGELLDFYNGRRDLERGLIRVLHSLSFIDDPTRILRAVRFEQRLNFRIEPRTAELIASALPMLDRVTGARIRHEIELALREPARAAVMARLAGLGVMAQIHPALHWTQTMAAAFARVPDLAGSPIWAAERPSRWLPFLYFAQWVIDLSPSQREAVMARLRVRKATREDVTAVVRCLKHIAALPAAARPSQIEKALRPFPPRVLLTARIALGAGVGSGLIELYYQTLRGVKTAVTGDDLRDTGLRPGPQYGVILDELLAARLDGRISSEAEERVMLSSLLVDLTE